MAIKQVAWNPKTQVATVQNKGVAAPSGSTVVGEFNHDVPAEDQVGPYKAGHVLYHHVQDVLYRKVQWTNMQMVTIKVDNTAPPGP